MQIYPYTQSMEMENQRFLCGKLEDEIKCQTWRNSVHLNFRIDTQTAIQFESMCNHTKYYVR